MTVETPLRIPGDHPAFAGHFPGRPIVPGVVLLDEALHVIASATGITLSACLINSVKFLSPLKPGEAAMILHEVVDNGTIRFEIVSGSRKIAAGSLTPEPKTPAPERFTPA